MPQQGKVKHVGARGDFGLSGTHGFPEEESVWRFSAATHHEEVQSEENVRQHVHVGPVLRVLEDGLDPPRERRQGHADRGLHGSEDRVKALETDMGSSDVASDRTSNNTRGFEGRLERRICLWQAVPERG